MNNEAIKLIVSLLFSFFVAFTSLEYFYILPVLLVLIYERKDVIKILKKLFLLNFFIIVLVIFVLFQNSQMAIELFLRTNLILLFNITIFYKSKGFDIVRGFNTLKISPKFISIFYFTICLIEYLLKEFKNIKNSLKARGFKAQTSMFVYQTFGNIFAMMFIKAIKKSQDMRLSMIARGFNSQIFLLENNKISQKDMLVLFFILSIFLIKVLYK
jgi:cobalt/nickel transport system permease protein